MCIYLASERELLWVYTFELVCNVYMNIHARSYRLPECGSQAIALSKSSNLRVQLLTIFSVNYILQSRLKNILQFFNALSLRSPKI